MALNTLSKLLKKKKLTGEEVGKIIKASQHLHRRNVMLMWMHL